MANRIKGITIEIGGDTTKLQKALQGANKTIRDTSADLRDINKLLKMDPGNTELIAQKQEALGKAVEATKEKLEQLKAVSKDSVSDDEWNALQREIIETEQRLKGLTSECENFGKIDPGKELKESFDKVESSLNKTKKNLSEVDKLLKLDPKNTELVAQKQKYLGEAIEKNKEKLKLLKSVSKDAVSPDEWDKVQREIIETEREINKLETEYKNLGRVDPGKELRKSFDEVESSLEKTKKNLSEVDKLLKLDPKNTELVAQKQKYLGEAIEENKKKLELLESVSKDAVSPDEWEKAQREIVATKNEIDKLRTEYENLGKVDPNENVKKSLKEVNTALEQTGERLKRVDELLKLDPGNADLLAQKQKLLTQEIDQTTQKLEAMKSVERNSLTTEEWDRLQDEIVQTEAELKNLEKEYEDFGSVAAQQTIVAGEKFKEVGGKISAVGSGIENAGRSLAPLSTAAAAALGGVIKVGSDFEAKMSEVGAIMQADADDAEKLKEAAIEMGEQTKFSASECADALKYMGMAGWDTKEAIAALPGVLNLAAASGEDLGTVSDIVTDAMTAFGMSADEAGHFADILASASVNANTDVAKMGETFKYVAPVAGSLGMSAEDVAQSVGLMANSGIKASQAGTSLRKGLLSLVNVTKAGKNELSDMGLVLEKTEHTFDEGKIEKATDKLAKANENLAQKQKLYNRAVEDSGVSNASLEKSIINLNAAQDKYNRAVSEGGVSSDNAISAKINLQKAQADYAAAVERTSDSEVKSNRKVQDAAEALAKAQKQVKDAQEELSEQKKGFTAVVGDEVLVLKDEDGNARSLADVMDLLREKTKDMTDVEKSRTVATIFGTNAVSGMLSILNASDEEYQSLRDSINGASDSIDGFGGVAEKIANEKMDNLQGDLELIQSHVESIAIKLYDTLVPRLRKFLDKVDEWISKFDNLDEKQKDLIIKIALFVAALAPALMIIGSLVSAIGSIVTAIGGVMTAAPAVIGFLSGVGGPILLIIAAIAGVIAIVKHLWDTNKEFRKHVNETLDEIKGKFDGFTDAIAGALKPVLELFGVELDEGADKAEIFGKTVDLIWDGIAKAFEGMTTYIGDKLEGTLDIMTGLIEGFTAVSQGDWDGAAEGWNKALDGFEQSATAGLDAFFSLFGSSWDEAKQVAIDKVAAMHDGVVGKIEETKQGVVDKVTSIHDGIVGKIEDTKQGVVDRVTAIHDGIVGKIDETKQGVVDRVTAIHDAVVGKINEVQTGVTEKVDAIKSKFTTAFDEIKSHVMGVVDYLKKAFDFKWELPKIKLPHFKIDGDFSIKPPKVPRFSVDWYKKAYDDAYLLNSPTIFGAAGGRLLGGGDGSGSEAVVGTDKLMGMMQQAVATAGGGDIIIPVYFGQEQLETLVVTAQQRASYRSGGR